MAHGLSYIVVSALVACTPYSQVSSEKEMLLGQQMAAEIDSRQRMITDVEVTEFVDRVLKNLSRDESLRCTWLRRFLLPGGFPSCTSEQSRHGLCVTGMASGRTTHRMCGLSVSADCSVTACGPRPSVGNDI